MFHDFIGKPSTSEGLSLAAINQSLVQILQWLSRSCAARTDVHVALLCDELHGPLDLQ